MPLVTSRQIPIAVSTISSLVGWVNSQGVQTFTTLWNSLPLQAIRTQTHLKLPVTTDPIPQAGTAVTTTLVRQQPEWALRHSGKVCPEMGTEHGCCLLPDSDKSL